MGPLQVMWVLVLSLSTCGEGQVNVTGKSVTVSMHHHLELYDDEAMMGILHYPLSLSIHDGQQLALLSSTSEHSDETYASADGLTGSGVAVNGAVNIMSREKEDQRKELNILELQNTREASMLSTDEASSVGQMLAAVVKAELRKCDLVVAYDTGYSEHAVLHHLLLLHNTRQVVYVNTTEDLTRIIWTSSKCRGYFFLLDDPEPLLTFATTYQDTWDYGGRFVLVVPSLQYLEAFIDSYIGERTEHVVGAVKSGTEGQWALYMNQLYWGPGVRRINTWYRHRFTRQLDLFPDKLSDLQGAVIKVSLFHFVPMNFLHRAENGTVLYRYGMDVEIIKAIARVLNITLEFWETPIGETWGDRYQNGSWGGLFGQLQRHEVDVGLAFLFICQQWQEVVDLTASFTAETLSFMTLTEPPLPHWQALAFPYHQWTWLAILVGLIVSGPSLLLLARCSERCGGEIKIMQDLSFAWYYAVGMHFCEAHASLPRNPGTQIFVLFLWLYTMILTIVYSANLKSFLLVKKQPAMMETFQDIYESGLGVTGLSPMFGEDLSSSGDPYLQALAKVARWFGTEGKALPLLLEGEAVYLVNSINADYLIKTRFTRRGVSSVRLLKGIVQTYNVGMGLQHHSPLKRKFDIFMGWVQQSGLVRKFYLDSIQLAASLGDDENIDDSGSGQEEDVAGADGVIPLSLDHMQGLFLITCFGWLSSLLSFMLEKTIFSDLS